MRYLQFKVSNAANRRNSIFEPWSSLPSLHYMVALVFVSSWLFL